LCDDLDRISNHVAIWGVSQRTTSTVPASSQKVSSSLKLPPFTLWSTVTGAGIGLPLLIMVYGAVADRFSWEAHWANTSQLPHSLSWNNSSIQSGGVFRYQFIDKEQYRHEITNQSKATNRENLYGVHLFNRRGWSAAETTSELMRFLDRQLERV
jgi:hypothetical protein